MLGAVLKGLAISLLLVFSVGPVIFTIIKQSVNNGLAGGFSFVSGVWLSDIIVVILSNLFSALVTEMLNFKKEIAFAGSIFLIGLGTFYIFFKKIKMRSEQEAAIKVSAATHAKLTVSGFLINTLNPAVFVFWLTLATTLAISNTVRERIVIFTTCILINMSADTLKVMLAGKLSNKLTHKNMVLVNKVSGALLLLFGFLLMINIWYSVTNK